MLNLCVNIDIERLIHHLRYVQCALMVIPVAQENILGLVDE